MTEIRSTGFELAGLAPLGAEKVVDGFTARTSAELARARQFGEGQLSGPFGPQFAGFGALPRAPLWQRALPWLLGLGCGALALAVDLVAGAI